MKPALLFGHNMHNAILLKNVILLVHFTIPFIYPFTNCFACSPNKLTWQQMKKKWELPFINNNNNNNRFRLHMQRQRFHFHTEIWLFHACSIFQALSRILWRIHRWVHTLFISQSYNKRTLDGKIQAKHKMNNIWLQLCQIMWMKAGSYAMKDMWIKEAQFYFIMLSSAFN